MKLEQCPITHFVAFFFKFRFFERGT